jgi:ubiquinone/menaquinone biosynthesis C-methylase UbiE
LKSKQYVTGVFSRNAEAYRQRLEEAMRKGQAAGRDALLDYLKPRPGMRILDLACGPGTLTIPMARELNGDGEVIGIDLADGMLEVARRATGGRSMPVRFLRMDVENLQFPAAAFDAASCGHGLHFMPNLGRALREVHRVLKPKGRFAASIPPGNIHEPVPASEAFMAALDRRLGAAQPPPELAETRRLLEDLDRFRGAALAAGFRFAETEQVRVETSWDGPAHYVEVNVNWWSNAVRLEGLSDHVRGLIVQELTKAVSKATGDIAFTAPSVANVLRAEA